MTVAGLACTRKDSVAGATKTLPVDPSITVLADVLKTTENPENQGTLKN
jgi:hypothetical protein